jgi:hypothetical protein
MITEETASRVWRGEKVTLLLECTCCACPEQYDAWTPDGRKVGYLRLRHGWFTVDAPDENGVTVYQAQPQGDGFFWDDERERYLDAACEVLAFTLAAAGLRHATTETAGDRP